MHEKTSLAAALLYDHVLVVTQHYVIALIIQHGERAEALGRARRTGNALWVVKLQQTLLCRKKNTHTHTKTTSHLNIQ